MKYLVTGGCGFIGSHIIDGLVELGHNVIVIDNLSGLNDSFYFKDGVKYYHEDIADYKVIEDLFKGVDSVFHLAAESRIQPCIENPSLAVRTNVTGTLNILEASRLHKVSKVIYSSTSSVYGLTETLPTNEETKIDCLNPYSTTKYIGEKLCRVYNSDKLDTCILRYFNVYGERSPTKGQYSPVIGLFLKNDEINVVGDGLNTRDFVHVKNVAYANILAATVKTNGTTFNIGSGESHSILDIANFICRSKPGTNIKFIPARQGEARNTLAGLTKVKRVLGWQPTIHLFDWITNEIFNN